MTKEIKYIEKVEIKGLWNKFDIEWNLNKDVNILSGGNGRGKSTILDAIYDLLIRPQQIIATDTIESINISFNNGKKALLHFVIVDKDDIPKYIQVDKHFTETIEMGLKKYGDVKFKIALMPNDIGMNEISQNININAISTFDTELNQAEEIQKLDNNIQTDLDFEIYKLQKDYISYQLNIAKRKDIITETSKNIKKEITKIRKPQNDFLGIIDTCFAETNKKINREKNEISFLVDDTEITAYQLSSGEKQLLIILLKTLIQDNKQSILFLDEPEISLHIDWQKQLIGFIRQLNPNVQIIMATHSPAMIMNGWLDKVFNVSDLIVPKSKL